MPVIVDRSKSRIQFYANGRYEKDPHRYLNYMRMLTL